MRQDDDWELLPDGSPLMPAAPQPLRHVLVDASAPALAAAPELDAGERPGRVHFVVVTIRAARAEDDTPPGASLISRYWHPRDQRWSENAFESLEHALRLFVDESGWVLRQQQTLDSPETHELVFEARREDFSRPSTEALLEEVGLTPREVAHLLDRVDRERPSP